MVVSLALIAGISNTLLLVIVNMAVKTASQAYAGSLLVSFAIIFVVYVTSQYSALRMITVVTERSLRYMRESNMRKLIGARQIFLEQYGHERIVAHLTKDISAMNNAVPVLVNIVIGGVTVISALIYLAYVSFIAFFYAMSIILLGVYLYMRVSNKSKQRLFDARKTEDVFLRHVTHLIKGSKELKLNPPRADTLYHDEIENNIGLCYEKSVSAKIQFAIAGQIGNSLFFLMIGVVSITPMIFPMLENVDKVSYVIMLVFLIGPISRVVSSIPSLYETMVSFHKVREFDQKLSAAQEYLKTPRLNSRMRQWDEIHFVNLTYKYDDNDKYPFILGPIDLSIHRGETIFIVGGNGSGKSTLGKLLTGLYVPTAGHIEVDGIMLDADDFLAYRQLFTSVFSDYYLFDKLYGVDETVLDKELHALLNKLELPKEVIAGNDYMRINELSQGQRKRLALATSYFENKEIFLFDEWASDQDPIFKKYFYNQFLVELKMLGKTIVAITHDDYYMDAADRVIKLQRGELISETKEAVP